MQGKITSTCSYMFHKDAFGEDKEAGGTSGDLTWSDMGLAHTGGDGLHAAKSALTRRREDAESTLEISLRLPRCCSALVHSFQDGDGQNRNCLMKIVTDPQRLPYRERWKSSGLHHLMKS